MKPIIAAARHRTLIQALFCVAVAALAAAFASPLVESLSNHGVFGSATFTDHSNADVVPVTLAGLLLAAAFLCVRIRHWYCNAGSRRRHELSEALSPHRLARMLPVVFILQIALLWTMESLEQHVVVGHGLGPLIWLGGPAAASLAIHAVFCVAATLLARRILIVVEPRAIHIIRAILAFLLRIFGASARPIQRRRIEISASTLSPALRHIGKRGPPLPHLS